MKLYKQGSERTTRKVLVYMALAVAISDGGDDSDDDSISQLCKILFEKYVKHNTVLDLCDYDYLLTEYCQSHIQNDKKRCLVYSLLSSRFLIEDKLCIEILKVDPKNETEETEDQNILNLCDVVESQFWGHVKQHVCKLNLNTKNPSWRVASIHTILSLVLFGNEYNTEFLMQCTEKMTDDEIIAYMEEKLDITIKIQPSNEQIVLDEEAPEVVYIMKLINQYKYYTAPYNKRTFSTEKEIVEYIEKIEKLATTEAQSALVHLENRYINEHDDIELLFYLTYDNRGAPSFEPITGMKKYTANGDKVLGETNTRLFVSSYAREVSTACDMNYTGKSRKNFEIFNKGYIYCFVVHGKKTNVYYTSWDKNKFSSSQIMKDFDIANVHDTMKLEYHSKDTKEKELIIIKLAAIFCRYVKRECHKQRVYPFNQFLLKFDLKSDVSYITENVVDPIDELFKLPFKHERRARERYNDSKEIDKKENEYVDDIKKIFHVDNQELSKTLRGPNKHFLRKFPSSFRILCLEDSWQLDYSFMIQSLEDSAMKLSYEDILLRSFMFINLIKDNVNVVNSNEMFLRRGTTTEWTKKYVICIVEFTGSHWGVLLGVKNEGIYQYDDQGWSGFPNWNEAIRDLGEDPNETDTKVLKTRQGDGVRCGVTVAIAIKLFCIYFENDDADFDGFEDYFNDKFKMESWTAYATRVCELLKKTLKYKDGVVELYEDIQVNADYIKFVEDEKKKLNTTKSGKSGDKDLPTLVKELKLQEHSKEMEIEFPQGYDSIFAQYARDGNETNFKNSYKIQNEFYRNRTNLFGDLKKLGHVDDVIIRLWQNNDINDDQIGNLTRNKKEVDDLFNKWKNGEIESGSQFIQQVCELLA